LSVAFVSVSGGVKMSEFRRFENVGELGGVGGRGEGAMG